MMVGVKSLVRVIVITVVLVSFTVPCLAGVMVVGKLKRADGTLLSTSRDVQLWTWVSGAPGSLVASGTTDTDGDCTFLNVANGQYCVKYKRPSTGVWYLSDPVSPATAYFTVNGAPVAVTVKMKAGYED